MAPKSNRERVKLFRQRMRDDPVKNNASLEKDKLRKKVERSKPVSREQKKETRRKARERKRKQRERQRQNENDPTVMRTPTNQMGAFSSNSSLGKAVKRIQNNLPKSPRRKSTAMADMISREFNKMTDAERQTFLEQVQHESVRRKLHLTNSNRKTRADALSNELKDTVSNFFNQDDISRVSPAARDFKKVVVNGEVKLLQKRSLMYNLVEAHQLFLEENPSLTIGLSKFAELRPLNVSLLSEKDQQVCMCRYHENVELLARELSKITRLPQNSDHIVEKTVCNIDNETCMSRECEACGTQRLDVYFDEDLSKEISYYQWSTGATKVMKIMQQCSIGDAKELLYDQVETLSRHCFDAKQQHRELRHLKDNLKPGDIIIHEDFAENFTIRQQGEIMSAHWCAEQVTVFTAIVYFRRAPGCELEHESYSIVSDCKNHDKVSVYAFNSRIIDDLKQKLPWPIRMIHYWSDGAGSQFKNKFCFTNLLYHQADFGSQADWSFFATSHGKGPIDGIGATIKRSVWRAILKNHIVINSSEDFHKAAVQLNASICVLYVSESDILSLTTHLKARWSASITVKGTQQYHNVRPRGESMVYCGLNSPFTDSSRVLCGHPVIKVNTDVLTDPLPEPSRCEQVRSVVENVAVSDFIIVEFR